MKIRWVSLSGTTFTTNAVPFENHVIVATNSRSDKTWNDFRGWSKSFAHFAEAKLSKREIVEGEEAYFAPATLVEKYTLFGEVIFRAYTKLIPADERGRGVLAPSGQEYQETGWIHEEHARFEVVSDAGDTIFQGPATDGNDWKIIAELSGQAERRRARVSLANQHGHMYPVLLNRLGIGIPRPEGNGKIVPLMADSFKPSNRGDGFAVVGLGKVMISKENQAGYYEVIRETEKVRFIRLVERYQQLEGR